jgi:hypothetical protein
MAIFPAIEPAARSYDLGAYPLVEQPSLSAGIVRFKHGFEPFDYRLNLDFAYLTDAQAAEIRDHFEIQAGSHRSFQLPSDIWKGHTFSGNVFPVGTRWRYAESIEETHHEIGRYSIKVALVSDGKYKAAELDPVTASFAPGTAFIQAGSFSVSVAASLVSGTATGA